ncbi:hypothetical protein Dimus_012723 [Dionaea muscipula]
MQSINRVRRICDVNPASIATICPKPISISTLSEAFKKNSARSKPNPIENPKRENKKAFDVLFKEAVGLIPKSRDSENESGTGSKDLNTGLMELEKELKELMEKPMATDGKRRVESGEREVERRERRVEGDGSKGKSLYQVFTNKDCKEVKKTARESEELVMKELSPDMEKFLRHLYDEGYFRDVTFLRDKRFDSSCFEYGYARHYLKFAAERFGKDNQEIAKWLSGSDLKTIALFGCPSLTRRSVFAAKGLRTFFEISENTVCCKCILRERCKFNNQSVWTKNSKNLNLSLIMRLLITYAMEAVSPQLVLSGEFKACVSRLINETIKLSKTVS